MLSNSFKICVVAFVCSCISEAAISDPMLAKMEASCATAFLAQRIPLELNSSRRNQLSFMKPYPRWVDLSAYPILVSEHSVTLPPQTSVIINPGAKCEVLVEAEVIYISQSFDDPYIDMYWGKDACETLEIGDLPGFSVPPSDEDVFEHVEKTVLMLVSNSGRALRVEFQGRSILRMRQYCCSDK